MTRKDYINISGAILAVQAKIRNDAEAQLGGLDPSRAQFTTHEARQIEHQRNAQLDGVKRAAEELADFLADDNPRGFDKKMFIRNCGYAA